MADEIERLDLVISSSTSKASKAVEDLITSLSKLESGLTSFSGDKLDGSIKNLSTTFRNLSEAINIVNVEKVSNLNKSIRTLASSLGKLDKASSLSSFGNAFSAMNDFKNTFNTEVESVIRDFGIVGKESTDEVTKSLREISNIAKQGANYDVDKMNNAIENVVNSLKSGATDVSNFKNEYVDLLEYIRNTKNKIYIPEAKDVVNYGEKRKRLGQNFTSNEKYRDRTDITAYVKEMQGLGLVPNIDTTRSSADVFDQLVQEVIKAREETDRLNEDFRKSKTTISAMYSSAMDFADAMLKANSVKEKALSGDVNGSQIAMTMEGIDSFSGINVDPDKAKDISNLASAFSKFGSKTATTAIKNIPQLSTALNQLITSVNKLPAVDKNIVDFTGNLARLAETGRKVGSVANSVNKNIATTQKSVVPIAMGTKRQFKGLASYIGKFYATYFMVIRGIRQLWGSVTSAMDYVEIYNYFDSAFGQVADKAVANWKDAGYESAEGYYNSFRQRASELTKQMTGYTVSDTGALSAVNQESLGLNVTQLMNYQSMFAQMSSSMGVASENALRLSRLMTELGADLASVKNMNFEEVWSNMASGIVGMSRTVDKYGINIRNAALQEELLNLGITTNITKLSQDEKALLRMIVMLDSTRYAWGDLANTINQPANELRLLQASFANLSRTIGNLFLPIVAKVIPYLNAVTIAITRVIQSFVNLLGFNVTDWGKGSSKSFTDLVDYMDDVSEATDTATGSAKEYQNTVMGFDEINKLNPETESSGGAGGAGGLGGGDLSKLQAAFDALANEYQASWDAAFEGMENRAQKMADKIEKAFQPVKDLAKHLYKGDFYAAGDDLSNIITGIYDTFSHAIEKVDWEEIGHNIGEFLRGLKWLDILKSALKLRFDIWKAIIDTWSGSFKAAPLETSLLTLFMLCKFTPIGQYIAKKIIGSMGVELTSSSSVAGMSGIIKTLFAKALEGAGVSGLGGFLTADIGTLLASGSFATIGLTVGTAIAGGLAAAFVGWNIGSALFEWISGEEAESFAYQMKYLFESPVESINHLPEAFGEALGMMSNKLIGEGSALHKTFMKVLGLEEDEEGKNKLVITVEMVTKEASDKLNELEGKIEEVKDKINNASSSSREDIKAAEDALNDAIKAQDELNKEFKTVTANYTKAKNTLDKYIKSMTGLTTEQFKQKYSANSLSEIYTVLSNLTSVEASEQAKLAEELGYTDAELQALDNTYNNYQQRVTNANNQVTEQAIRLRDLAAEFDKTGQGAYQFSSDAILALINVRTTFSSAYADMTRTSRDSTNAFTDDYKRSMNSLRADTVSSFAELKNNIINYSTTAGSQGGNNLYTNFKARVSNLPLAAQNAFAGIVGRVNAGQIGKTEGEALANNLINGFNAHSNSVKNTIQSTIRSGLYADAKISITPENTATNIFSRGYGLSLGSIKVTPRANGGYVDPGQLFVAREAGPEMVGTIGGRTAVANNDQITTAIASAVAPAVYNAVVQAMGNLNTNVNVNLVGDAEGLFTAVVDQDRNYQRRTGSSAFA